jgi:Ca-activated chloride channel family protein
MTNILRTAALVGLLALGLSGFAQNTVQQVVPEKTRILFVLDGSGSMNATWSGDKSRMDVAKEILSRLVDSLRVNPNLELALRVYGHRFTRQANNCEDSKLEVPFGIKNHNLIITKIKEINAKGTTDHVLRAAGSERLPRKSRLPEHFNSDHGWRGVMRRRSV